MDDKAFYELNSKMLSEITFGNLEKLLNFTICLFTKQFSLKWQSLSFDYRC